MAPHVPMTRSTRQSRGTATALKKIAFQKPKWSPEKRKVSMIRRSRATMKMKKPYMIAPMKYS